jgi:hypothetical protein
LAHSVNAISNLAAKTSGSIFDLRPTLLIIKRIIQDYINKVNVSIL